MESMECGGPRVFLHWTTHFESIWYEEMYLKSPPPLLFRWAQVWWVAVLQSVWCIFSNEFVILLQSVLILLHLHTHFGVRFALVPEKIFAILFFLVAGPGRVDRYALSPQITFFTPLIAPNFALCLSNSTWPRTGEERPARHDPKVTRNTSSIDVMRVLINRE